MQIPILKYLESCSIKTSAWVLEISFQYTTGNGKKNILSENNFIGKKSFCLTPTPSDQKKKKKKKKKEKQKKTKQTNQKQQQQQKKKKKKTTTTK